MTAAPDGGLSQLEADIAALYGHCEPAWQPPRRRAVHNLPDISTWSGDMSDLHLNAEPEPRQTRRDVSWSVMFRLARTGVWSEWSNGHRNPAEAISAAEVLVPMEAVAEIRFDRVTRQRDMFSLHDLAQAPEEVSGR